MKQCTFKVWNEDNFVKAEIRLTDFAYEVIFNFRDLLIKHVKDSGSFAVWDGAERENPTELDSEYIVFDENVFEEARKRIKEFHVHSKSSIPSTPSFLSAMFNMKKSQRFNEWIKKRNQLWKDSVLSLATFGVETEHDYPYIECWSRIHAADEFSQLVCNVANELSIEIKQT